MATSPDEQVPLPGQWPVDPQEDVPISEDRIWVDGCFDFSHHGKINTALDLRLQDLTDVCMCTRSCWSDASSSPTRQRALCGDPFRPSNLGEQRSNSDVAG